MHVPDPWTCTDADINARAGRRILLLEEDDYLASLLDMLLQREGFEIRALNNPEGARSYLQQASPPDLVFINSGWISDKGIEVLGDYARRIEWQRVPMIMLLGFYDADKINRALELGISDYLLQPFEPGELIDIIHRYI